MVFYSAQVKLSVLDWLYFQKSKTNLKIVAMVMRKLPNLFYYLDAKDVKNTNRTTDQYFS